MNKGALESSQGLIGEKREVHVGIAISEIPAELREKRDRLLDLLRSFGSCAVAFSGGLDSAVLAKAAHAALGERAVAVTGVSASLAAGELEDCRRLAAQIGIRHVVLETDELRNPLYQRNLADRCYFCKTELFTKMGAWAGKLGVAVVVDGSNRDDRGDHRPGMTAAREHAVRSPLAECDLSKEEIRLLAKHWGLPIWDKPASPCLSSRIAYGEAVTPERLAMVERAERFLREQGFRLLRVRYHKGDLARIEVPVAELSRLLEPALREALLEELRAAGFKFVTLDLMGFRSGSLNQLVPAESLQILDKR
ncbi:MAG: ATP-dependent sacrificial sulfur transferase LarE [Thermogutta sp.]